MTAPQSHVGNLNIVARLDEHRTDNANRAMQVDVVYRADDELEIIVCCGGLVVSQNTRNIHVLPTEDDQIV